jgi:hypothetical protein
MKIIEEITVYFDLNNEKEMKECKDFINQKTLEGFVADGYNTEGSSPLSYIKLKRSQI